MINYIALQLRQPHHKKLKALYRSICFNTKNRMQIVNNYKLIFKNNFLKFILIINLLTRK